jgi:hypothetical protein
MEDQSPDGPTGFGSREAAAQGGKARAQKLSPEERRDIAARGGQAKAEKAGKAPLPVATHAGPLEVSGVTFECAVLEGGVRVIAESSFMESMGMYYSGWVAAKRKDQAGDGSSAVLPLFASQKAIQPFIDKDLRDLLSSPIHYKTLEGRRAKGVRAEIIPKICNVWLKARDEARRDGRELPKRIAQVAENADMLIRGLAEVGIIALVDEATGFQLDRPRRDLEQYLAKFISESLRKYVPTFPADYFKHLCRLRGVDLRADMRLPPYFGALTNNLIYRRIAPGLLAKLKEAKAEKGRPGNKLFQWTSEHVGLRALNLQLGTVVALMKINNDYDTFERQLDHVAPIYEARPGLFDNPEEWEPPKD